MRDVCFYDGHCGMCRRTTAVLRRLDWLGRLDFRDMNTEADLPVRFEEAMAGMPMRTRGGRVLVGYPAVRRALLQTPVGLPIAALLYLPGIAAAGRRTYRYIAANRARDACRIAPAPNPSEPRTPPSAPAPHPR